MEEEFDLESLFRGPPLRRHSGSQDGGVEEFFSFDTQEGGIDAEIKPSGVTLEEGHPCLPTAADVKDLHISANYLAALPYRADPRKYDRDAMAARLRDFKVIVTRDDRMPVLEAKAALDRLRERARVYEEENAVEAAARHDAALWFCHTVNGASTLNPGRSTFGATDTLGGFSYGDVMRQLGPDARRFFRAYADDITEVNRKVLADLDLNDPASVENYGWLLEVAATRGISKYPYLAHDSADACLYLNTSERAAVIASKKYVTARVHRDAPELPTYRVPQRRTEERTAQVRVPVDDVPSGPRGWRGRIYRPG